MKTQIFKTYNDFLKRKDKYVNGVSLEFTKENSNYENDNTNNIGCWNCMGCKECNWCKWCVECEGCKECNWCRGCYWCEECKGCLYCKLCLKCKWCEGCTRCQYCNNEINLNDVKNMKTEVFKNYADFRKREDKNINGVSPYYAENNPNYEVDNNSNIGCWNCLGCEDCKVCEECNGCKDCIGCDECKDCTGCKWCKWGYKRYISVGFRG